MTDVTSLKIGGAVWSILPDASLSEEGLHGECFVAKMEIRLNPDLCSQQKEITILHEVLHAMWEMAGLKEGKQMGEEDCCGTFAPQLWQFIKDNPSFFQ